MSYWKWGTFQCHVSLQGVDVLSILHGRFGTWTAPKLGRTSDDWTFWYSACQTKSVKCQCLETNILILGSKLPWFPYNRGWSSSQLEGCRYPLWGSPFIGGMTIPNMRSLDPGTYILCVADDSMDLLRLLTLKKQSGSWTESSTL